jgi:DNA polymerase-3 subunit alpha
MDIIPLFKSHYSIGRSILTLEDEDHNNTYPDSIINIIKENNLKSLYLVEDNMSSFLQAYTNTKKNNINLRYGLRITVTDNMEDKSDESRVKNCKFIIFFKNNEGYRKLIKIFSIAAKNGFYYEPRIDYKTLKSLWDNKDLLLCVPFYDSFIFNNLLRNSLCTPQLDFCSPTFFIEDNGIPFDSLIKSKVLDYCDKNKNDTMNVKSVFYKTKSDFKAYLTFRCINVRTTLNKPEIEHMTSDTFCFESWMEKIKNG